MKDAMKGSSVIASAGIIGSGNILVIITSEIIWPKANIIAIYIKAEKCKLENKLQIPKNESKVNSHPLMK
jgi:hypothetical protein